MKKWLINEALKFKFLMNTSKMPIAASTQDKFLFMEYVPIYYLHW